MAEILWATAVAFTAFEIALGLNYVLLRCLLRAMHAGLQRPARPVSGNIVR